jgi:ubiquinone biosynthesis protein
MSIRGDIEKIERLEDIVGILFKQELGYLLDRLDLTQRLPIHKEIRAKRHPKPKPERLRETFEELGTVFIKFGQILSERPDIVPEDYAEELSKLQDSVPPFDSEKARQIVDEEIGLENLEEFDEEPMASASIAQVHRATLKNGEEIVLKVRRPGIEEEVHRDLEVLLYLAKKADKHVDIGKDFLYGEAREFAEWTREELDFKKELRTAETFRENMENEERIRVPETYREYSSERILAMEYVDAVKCDDIERIRKMEIDEKEIAETGIRCVLKQILRDGLLHADPHPSNFMVDHDGNLVFLDFGMMTRITEETQRELGMLKMQISKEDIEGLLETVTNLSEVSEDAELDKLKREMEREILKLRDTSIQEQSISKVLIRLSTKSAQHGVYLPTKVTLIGKGILTMEGIGLEIYPDFQIQNAFDEEVEKLLIKQNKPQDMMKDFAFNLIQNQDIITKLPEKINDNLEKDAQPQTLKVQSKGIDLLPAALIISSTALIAASLLEKNLLYIGLLELVIGLHFYRN